MLGIMGQSPFAGVAWQALHYLEGFRALGADVYYVEDTGVWAYDPEQNTVTDDCAYAVNYISKQMAWCGLPDRWAFRGATAGRTTFGLSTSRFLQLFEEADVLINLTGSTALRDEHLRVSVRIYLETDPVLPQIEVAKGNTAYIDMLSAHTHHFTYGENFGAPDCGVPVERFHYLPTRQPIVLNWWTPSPRLTNGASAPLVSSRFSTIANWRQSGKDVEWNGETYTWSKHHGFLKFLELPSRTKQPFELALALRGQREGEKKAWIPSCEEDADAVRILTAHGWRIIDAMSLSKEILSYRDYISCSRGEFTVAKDQYARLRSGWFSDRSASYLAAGKPVITQETGFSKFIPVGEGLFAYNTFDEAVKAFLEIDADYAHHCRAARELLQRGSRD